MGKSKDDVGDGWREETTARSKSVFAAHGRVGKPSGKQFTKGEPTATLAKKAKVPVQ